MNTVTYAELEDQAGNLKVVVVRVSDETAEHYYHQEYGVNSQQVAAWHAGLENWFNVPVVFAGYYPNGSFRYLAGQPKWVKWIDQNCKQIFDPPDIDDLYWSTFHWKA